MKIINKLTSFAVLSLCFLSASQAFGEIDYSGNESASNCYTESKIGRVDQITTDEEGVFLLVDGLWIGTQGMQAVPDGILVLENGEWMSLEEAVRCGNYYVWKCSVCGAFNAQGSSRCYNYRNHPK